MFYATTEPSAGVLSHCSFYRHIKRRNHRHHRHGHAEPPSADVLGNGVIISLSVFATGTPLINRTLSMSATTTATERRHGDKLHTKKRRANERHHHHRRACHRVGIFGVYGVYGVLKKGIARATKPSTARIIGTR